jgi:hypothetical protein
MKKQKLRPIFLNPKMLQREQKQLKPLQLLNKRRLRTLQLNGKSKLQMPRRKLQKI